MECPAKDLVRIIDFIEHTRDSEEPLYEPSIDDMRRGVIEHVQTDPEIWRNGNPTPEEVEREAQDGYERAMIDYRYEQSLPLLAQQYFGEDDPLTVLRAHAPTCLDCQSAYRNYLNKFTKVAELLDTMSQADGAGDEEALEESIRRRKEEANGQLLQLPLELIL